MIEGALKESRGRVFGPGRGRGQNWAYRGSTLEIKD